MNELNLTTPSLLFSAISLILLAYTNRFLSYASVVRTLNERYQANPDQDPTTLEQIRNFVLRLRLIRAMQTFGAISLLLCLTSMFFFSIDQHLLGEIIFGAGMVSLAVSLAICIWEIQISTEAIGLHLQNIRRRQRDQDPFIGNALRRKANRREGESLGEQNTRKNREKQLRDKQEREERKAKEKAQKQPEEIKVNREEELTANKEPQNTDKRIKPERIDRNSNDRKPNRDVNPKSDKEDKVQEGNDKVQPNVANQAPKGNVNKNTNNQRDNRDNNPPTARLENKEDKKFELRKQVPNTHKDERWEHKQSNEIKTTESKDTQKVDTPKVETQPQAKAQNNTLNNIPNQVKTSLEREVKEKEGNTQPSLQALENKQSEVQKLTEEAKPKERKIFANRKAKTAKEVSETEVQKLQSAYLKRKKERESKHTSNE